jgi:hypothetical protein
MNYRTVPELRQVAMDAALAREQPQHLSGRVAPTRLANDNTLEIDVAAAARLTSDGLGSFVGERWGVLDAESRVPMLIGKEAGHYPSVGALDEHIQRLLGGRTSGSLLELGEYVRVRREATEFVPVFTYGNWVLDNVSDADGGVWIAGRLAYSPAQAKSTYDPDDRAAGEHPQSMRINDLGLTVSLAAFRVSLVVFKQIGAKLYNVDGARKADSMTIEADFYSSYRIAGDPSGTVITHRALSRRKRKTDQKKMSLSEFAVGVSVEVPAGFPFGTIDYLPLPGGIVARGQATDGSRSAAGIVDLGRVSDR